MVMAKARRSRKPRMTQRQRLWLAGYLLHGNASQAAREAGYKLGSAKQQGTENLAKPVLGPDPVPWTGTDLGLKRSAAAVSSRS